MGQRRRNDGIVANPHLAKERLRKLAALISGCPRPEVPQLFQEPGSLDQDRLRVGRLGPAALKSGLQSSRPSDVLLAGDVVGDEEFPEVGEPAQRALADIARTERKLGRVLAPARIIRVVLLPPGAEYNTGWDVGCGRGA